MVERKNRYIRNKNILFALLMAGFALGFLHLGMPKGRVVVCKADYFVFLSEGNMIFGTFFFLPVFLFCLTAVLQNTVSYQNILRLRRRKYVWYNQVCHLIQTALYQTVSLTFFTLVYTVWRKEPFLNWDQEESLYWMMTGQDTLHDERISFGVILAMFAVIQFLFLMVEGIIFLLCFFITSHVWAGWIVCESLMIAGRLSALNISWEKWRYWKRFGNTVVESIFILILLIVLGRLISGRKDYYEKK